MTAATTALARSRQELGDLRCELLRRRPGELAVVMTMGALHGGHTALLQAARTRVGPAGRVMATIFVNPLQFGPGEDYDRYPRGLDADVALCAEHGTDLVFAPGRGDMYPDGPPLVQLHAGPLGDELEGAARPRHFAGVLTVVAKLLGLTRPDVAVLGEKDYQQLVLVRRMVADLDLGVDVLGVATVRDADGLALSSRNRWLSADERTTAQALPAALRAGAAAGREGPAASLGAAAAVLDAAGLQPDYLTLRSPDLGPAPPAGAARLLVAARVGTVRLIDNTPVLLGE